MRLHRCRPIRKSSPRFRQRLAEGRSCSRRRPIRAKTKPSCRHMTRCGSASPISSPSSRRATANAAPTSRCCAGRAKRGSARRKVARRKHRHLHRRHDGRTRTLLSARDVRVHRWQPDPARWTKPAGARPAALRRDGGAAHVQLHTSAYDAIFKAQGDGSRERVVRETSPRSPQRMLSDPAQPREKRSATPHSPVPNSCGGAVAKTCPTAVEAILAAHARA